MVRPGRDNLSGVVEIDETYIGGKSSEKRGRGAENKCLVAVAVEDKNQISPTGKGIGRIRLGIMPDASATSLNTFIQDHISEGSHIRTDGWRDYQNIPDLGYNHMIVDSKELNIAHLAISLLNRWLLGTYQGAQFILGITLMSSGSDFLPDYQDNRPPRPRDGHTRHIQGWKWEPYRKYPGQVKPLLLNPLAAVPSGNFIRPNPTMLRSVLLM